MITTILLTILSAVTNFIFTAASNSLMHLFNKQTPVAPDDRQAALTGKWTGMIRQLVGIKEARNTTVEVVLRAGKRRIDGEATISFVDREGRTIKMGIDLEGWFSYGSFLELRYRADQAKNPGVIQFGTITLELSMDGTRLRGAFSGAGHLSQRVIWGTMKLTKVP